MVPEDEGTTAETDCGYTQDVSIRNDTGFDIWYVYISPTDSDDWGEDRLGDEVILDGDSFTIRITSYNVCYTKLLRVATAMKRRHRPHNNCPAKPAGRDERSEAR